MRAFVSTITVPTDVSIHVDANRMFAMAGAILQIAPERLKTFFIKNVFRGNICIYLHIISVVRLAICVCQY